MSAWVYDDGGRKAAGRRGTAGDCACRAIAIASELPYADVYEMLNEFASGEKHRRGKVGVMASTGRGSSARTGILLPTTRAFMASLGWAWTPTMRIGSGCTVHLKAAELPSGRIIAALSRHVVAVVDGVVHDTYDSTRDGTRCVYGYWSKP